MEDGRLARPDAIATLRSLPESGMSAGLRISSLDFERSYQLIILIKV